MMMPPRKRRRKNRPSPPADVWKLASTHLRMMMMMLTRKRRRKNRPSPPADEWTLPSDLLLEIVARSDPATLIRCAAACKLLRRDILDPHFIRRVTRHGGAVPPCVLAYLHSRPMRGRSHNRSLEPLISLVHPATRAASSFTAGNLAPYTLRHGYDVLRQYEPLTSSGGLVVLRRRYTIQFQTSMLPERCPGLCVFDPMTGGCTYLSGPPGLRRNWHREYVLLTAADGIGCSFMLLATGVDFGDDGVRITAQAAKASEAGGASWGPVASDHHLHLPFRGLWLQGQHDPVVLHGGVVHWLLEIGDEVLTYDIRSESLGRLKLPRTNCGGIQRLLGKSPDGRLRLLAAERFMVSMWLRLSDNSWVKEATINVEQKLRSLNPNTFPSRMLINFECLRERSGAVLLWVYRKGKRRRRGPLLVLDLETKEMRRQESYCDSSYPPSSLLFEVDLSLRLQAMKTFS